jgi:integrase/recombinase XerD
LFGDTRSSENIAVPAAFIALIDEIHQIRLAQSEGQADQAIWPHDRVTMRNEVNRVIRLAGITGGRHAQPRGIRFGFLVEAIRCGIILTRTERWMGYSHTNPLGHYVEQLALLCVASWHVNPGRSRVAA